MRVLRPALLFFVAISLTTSLAPGQEQHPIFSDENWTLGTTREAKMTDDNGTEFVWRKSVFYARPTPQGLYNKSIHTVFGETVVKVYIIDDKNGEPVQRWVQLEKDGKWYTAENGKAVAVNDDIAKDASGKITGITIVLYDKDGNEVVRREVKRK